MWMLMLIAFAFAHEPPQVDVMLSFGEQCKKAGKKDVQDADDVKRQLEEAGLGFSNVEAGATCMACGECPRLAVSVRLGAEDAGSLADVFGKEAVGEPKPVAAAQPVEAVPISIGAKCEPFPENAPKTPDELREALGEAGIEVEGIEAMMTCAACGCPGFAATVQVAGDKRADVEALVQTWTVAVDTEAPKTSLPPTKLPDPE